jgi:hypothetical protein
MPSISYNGQSFAIDGRRFWVLGASIQYARVPHELWASRIAAAKQAGFNTIETACPWVVHEPRTGRFHFEGDANIRKFIQTCAAQGCRVILRVGPYVNDQFDGGGLPGWLIEMPEVRLRQNNPIFLEHVSRYFRRLLSEVSDLQITSGGPMILVQSEHAWTCTNEAQAKVYLHEITRFIRESGVTVPIINTNDLWQDSPGTIDTWRGYEHLLAHLRQLRTVQPDAPRLVTFEAADVEVWGGEAGRSGRRAKSASKSGEPAAKSAGDVLRHLAEVLASGAQPIVSPFHAGTNFEFLAGRIAGRPDGFVSTAGAQDPPLGQAGARGEKYHAIRRLITFVSHFSHIFADLDPDYQPIVIDPMHSESGEVGARQSVVPLRGAQGRIVFVFAGEHDRKAKSNPSAATATIVLDDGIRLPVHLGDQSVGWFALDVDLQGLGTLDFSNICPWARVDRSIIVFHGPAGAPAYISISSTPLEVTVPTNQTPVVVEHKGLTIVVCNQAQIDATYHDESAVYMGIDGFDANGLPLRDPRFAKAYAIRKNASISELPAAPLHVEEPKKKKGEKDASRKRSAEAAPKTFSPIHFSTGSAVSLGTWQLSPAMAYVNGESPRFASLEGPETLSHCGAPSGYGWYRAKLNASGRMLCHAPRANDRLHMFIDGQRQELFGVGPGAHAGVFELRPSKTAQTLVALVDNFGRFAEGNDLGQCKGLWGHLYQVKPLRGVKPKAQEAAPVDPFVLRGFIAGQSAGTLSDSTQAVWIIHHTRKTAIIIDINGAVSSGTLVLNDKPIAYYAGASGGCIDRIVLDPADNLKRGKNVLRFAPDLRQDNAVEDIIRNAELFECVEALTENANAWAFAKWEPPHTSTFDEYESAALRAIKGLPCWWRSTFDVEQSDPNVRRLPLWLELNGMSKGQAFINGRNIGRYFTATSNGKPVGPQTRLYVPDPWLKPGHPNEVMIFEEHGCEPARVKLLRAGEA